MFQKSFKKTTKKTIVCTNGGRGVNMDEILNVSMYLNFTGLMVPAVVCFALGLVLIVSLMCCLFRQKR